MQNNATRSLAGRQDSPVTGWAVSTAPIPYLDAVAAMEKRVAAIHAGTAAELVWLLEHPPLYTAGTSAKPGDLLEPDRLPVYRTGRGGEYTYHGPGQRIAYVMLDLARRGQDVRAFVRGLEEWIIAALAAFSIAAERREGRPGVWVRRPGAEGEDKIAAIGVRVRRWVTFHGISLNIAPDLSHYTGIVPCGITDSGVTSLKALGVNVSAADVDQELRRSFAAVFGPVSGDEPAPLFSRAEI